ncbi:hypothetical protein ACFL3X_01635 [Gemmatimonadota bacterium]
MSLLWQQFQAILPAVGIAFAMLAGLGVVMKMASPKSWINAKQLLLTELALSIDIGRVSRTIKPVSSVIIGISYLRQNCVNHESQENSTNLDIYESCHISRAVFWISDCTVSLWLIIVVVCIAAFPLNPIIPAIIVPTFFVIITASRIRANDLSRQLDQQIVGSKNRVYTTLINRGVDVDIIA